MNNDIIVSREKHFAEKVVFVDGLPGSGKSLFSPIIASMDRVELLNYTYEIEHICALKYLSKISMDAAEVMVRMQTDLKIYNTMMGREVNFRPTDVSSATQNHDPIRYFKRLFEVGDEAIPELIHRDRPILNLTTHQLLAFSEPIWRGLGARCVFIEILRHPLYMFRQQLWIVENTLLHSSARNFDVCISYKGHEVPYYALGKEEKYINLPAEEIVINYLLHITELTNNARKKMLMDYDATIVTIPFEEFVVSPEKWVDKITIALGTKPSEYTNNAMKKQNVPRKKIAQSVDIPVYRRTRWVPPIDGASERDELLNRRRDIVQKVSSEAMGKLDQLCGDYEDKYWSPA